MKRKMTTNTLLKPNKNSVTMSNEQLPQENVFLLYLQERRRALLTELRMIERLQEQMKGQVHAR